MSYFRVPSAPAVRLPYQSFLLHFFIADPDFDSFYRLLTLDISLFDGVNRTSIGIWFTRLHGPPLVAI